MQNLELNKIAASILLAGLIGMVVGSVTSHLYAPEEPEKRGYSIAGAEVEGEDDGAPAEEAEIDILAYLNQADPARGEGLVKKCLACHSFEQGGPNKVGPNLYGVVGADKAHKTDYAYSDAMASAGGNWSFEDLSQFLKAPKALIPGTKMVFAGMRDPQQRADLIAWLNQNSASPLAVPAYTAPETAPLSEETPAPAIDSHDIETDHSAGAQATGAGGPVSSGNVGSGSATTAPSSRSNEKPGDEDRQPAVAPVPDAPAPKRHAAPEPGDSAGGTDRGVIEHRGENAPTDSENNPPRTETR